MTNAAVAALEAPLDINPFMPPSVDEPAKPSGVSYRENRKAEVTDLMASIKAVAVGQRA